MVLHSRAPTIRRRHLRLERIHAKTRLERRGVGNRQPPESGGRNDRQIRHSNVIPIHRRGRRPAPETIGRVGTPRLSRDAACRPYRCYSSKVSIRSARLKSSSVKPPLLWVETARRTL